MTLALLWLACLVVNVTFCAVTVLVARPLGGRIGHVGIFLGPPVLRFSFPRAPVRVGAVPVPAGYVHFEAAPRDGDPDRTQLEDLSRGRRIAIILLPWLAVALAVVAVLGPTLGLGAIGRGFVQLFAGAASPNVTGRALVAALVELAETAPFHVLAALVAAKLVAFNLLPLPGLAGRAFLLELSGRSYRAPLPKWLSLPSAVVMAALTLLWLWAVIAYWLA